MDKCLVFTIKGNYARFRKPYTTTSALTYTVIHPIAIKGLIGAISGVDREDLYQQTREIKLGIEVLSPVRKDLQSVKLLSLKGSSGDFHFPSNVEFLREQYYRIYTIVNSQLYTRLKQALKSGEYVFTPYLGVSEHIAKLNYEGEFEVDEFVSNEGTVHSIIPAEKIELNVEQINGLRINVDNIPVKNNVQREYVEYNKVVFSDNEMPLKGEVSGKIYKVGDKNVYFF